ncbi:c-type cytochrome [Noviherbaspirillum sp. Root189]|uniref:c-type cytochrome n=1 Tax=Noviherbaspirillum sp. Root189 TaxID=1736487 RepID=UPI00070CD590|nr:cytochrome c [Noviherbaspirillum sp. Root189]KRB79207.1 alcohol dehydrogenase [Noviherbaspirillum sp. Root189]
MKRILLVLLVLVLCGLGITAYFGTREDDVGAAPAAAQADAAELVKRGAYLARAGDCMACHTTRGGAAYAGGRAIQTPFGAIHAPNITSDKETGIGDWNADDFWRAIHNGKSKDGTLLYPAFPYPNYTRVTRADSDALYAYFKTVPPVHQVNKEPELRFPFNYRFLLAGWRALYFRPGVYEAEPTQNAEWNRGAYLVQGLGHCSACHAPRNFLGATTSGENLSGAMIPMLNWYASSLTGERGEGLGKWEVQHIVDLLKTGVSAQGAASGPMAEVVQESLQYLDEKDVRAMAVYLKSLPQNEKAEEPAGPRRNPETEQMLSLGASLYEKHCVECHKASGEGQPPGYPALAGNRSLLLASPVNPIRAVLHGGYPPSTAGNPRPYGMPPFGAILNDDEVAAVVSFVRNNWGNRGSMVTGDQINNYRSIVLE